VHSFETAVVVLGACLAGGAILSGVAHRSFLSLTALFVITGFVLGQGGFEVLDFSAESGFVRELAIVALIVILFRDGLEVESEMLQRAWHLPARNLAIGMPLTCGIIAVATHALTDLTWTESFLVGALLSPTDPVLSSSVVTNPRVPRLIRHSLNLESGLNDGLALAPVLALAAALNLDNPDFTWWSFVLQDVGLGVVFGVGCALIASVLLPREGIPDHQKALYGLGVAFLTYGVTTLPPHGNGVIAVFVAGIVLGIRRPDVRAYVASRGEDIVEIVKLGVFVVFGSLLTFNHLFEDGWAAVAIVIVTLLVARPVAIWLALAGTRTDAPTKAFIAWFGPKGVATMTFSLLILSQPIAQNERIFDICALVVFCSILAHGLTDQPGSEWIARRSPTREEPPAPEPTETRTSAARATRHGS
jgi:NhaP-type Na+/H+ or K+/H+ antiporter